MTMPSVRSVGAVAAGAGATTVNPGASHSADDIDVILAECNDSDTMALTTANGFARITALDQTGPSSGTQMSWWWRRWNGSDGSPVFTDAGNHILARMISVQDCVTTGDPWDILDVGTNDLSADTTVSIVGGTTTVADVLALLGVCQELPDTPDTTAEFSSPANTDLANLTERFDNTTNVGSGGAIGLWTGEKASAGAFGATTATAATSARRLCGMLALKGVSSGVTVTPATVAVVLAHPAPAIQAASTVTPATVAVALAFPAPTAQGAATVNPNALGINMVFPGPQVHGEALVAPAAVPVTIAAPTPAALAGATVAPTAVAITLGFPAPTILVAPTVAPAAVPIAIGLPTPTIDVAGAATTVTPATVAIALDYPAAGIAVAALVTPGVVAVVVALPTPVAGPAVGVVVTPQMFRVRVRPQGPIAWNPPPEGLLHGVSYHGRSHRVDNSGTTKRGN